MHIQNDLVVGISYTLRENGNEDIIESVKAEKPFYFLFGSGNLLPAFEEALEGKAKGEDFQFVLSAEEAYGPVDENAVVDLPVSAFMIDGKFAEEHVIVGELIQMQDPEGNPLMGKVVKRGLDAVTIDFNHPMAGKELNFSGTVIEVREATEEEMAHGHAHGPDTAPH
jgi:FKBP-type peptidyl-prolyl cis-trans isomerase SlyD